MKFYNIFVISPVSESSCTSSVNVQKQQQHHQRWFLISSAISKCKSIEVVAGQRYYY